MKRQVGLAWAAAIACWWLLTSTASAQTPPLPPPSTPPAIASPVPEPAFAVGQTAHAEQGACPWDTDLLIGLPTGIRVQGSLHPDQPHPLVYEAFVGLYAIFPMAGGGVRWNCLTMHEGNDTLTMAPGLDAYLFYDIFYHAGGWFNSNVEGGAIVMLDVDFVWRHAYSEHFVGELGVKFGCGALLANGGVPLPEACIFGGFGF